MKFFESPRVKLQVEVIEAVVAEQIQDEREHQVQLALDLLPVE